MREAGFGQRALALGLLRKRGGRSGDGYQPMKFGRDYLVAARPAVSL
jgi:hypothetical protein